MTKGFALYYAALDAAAAWSNALVDRSPGELDGDARYGFAGVETPELLALCQAKKKADAAWLDEMRVITDSGRFSRLIN